MKAKEYEILAPVGGHEQLLAAVRCGADAVYLGTKGFNARRSAENFDSVSLAEAVNYCHRRGVRVHVTVNTLVRDDEFAALDETAAEIAAAGADVVIVQDPAVMELFHCRYPTIEVHASTQCVVHNTDGARLLAELGCEQIVVARELSIREIAKIKRETGLKIEAFVHGALCMSMSGGCYLSSLIGGRSGNRGMCAQPCRLNFKCGGEEFALSLKDMSHVAHLRELQEAGVSTFKIEGRMKRPEYVAAAVTACRAALAGEKYDMESLRAVFSRGGFTDGYATGKRTGMFGHREHEDVTAAAGVLKKLSALYDRERQSVPVDMKLNIGGDSSALSIDCGELTAEAEGAGGIAGTPTTEEHAARNLSRLGGTPYYMQKLTVDNPAGLMLPPSAMNALRRAAVERLDVLRGAAPHIAETYEPVTAPYEPPEQSELWARFQTAEQFTDMDVLDRVILPMRGLIEKPELIAELGDRLICEPPAICFPENEDEVRESIAKLCGLGLKRIWAENAYAIWLGREHGLEIYGGAGLNILNSRTLDIYRRLGLSAATVSYELGMSRIARLGGELPRGFVTYGYLPAMRVRSCPNRNATGCKGCDGRPHLTDRRGVDFPMLCNDRRFTTILNSLPLSTSGKFTARTDYRLLYFTVETAAECARIAEDVASDRPYSGQRTGGLYYRELL